jgi:hypothetical protein
MTGDSSGHGREKKKFTTSLSGTTAQLHQGFNSLSLELLKLQMEPIQNGFSSLVVKSHCSLYIKRVHAVA